MKRIASVVVVALVAFACGGTVDDGDGGTKDSSPDEGTDAHGDSGGPIACGTTTCFGTDVCFHPCCGGAHICEPLDDGGLCPSGESISQTCPTSTPCTYVCTPPPPYCGQSNGMCLQGQRDCYLACG